MWRYFVNQSLTIFIIYITIGKCLFSSFTMQKLHFFANAADTYNFGLNKRGKYLHNTRLLNIFSLYILNVSTLYVCMDVLAEHTLHTVLLNTNRRNVMLRFVAWEEQKKLQFQLKFS